MEIKEKYPEQVDPAERTSGSGRGTRGPLDRLALIAFSGFALMYFVVFFYALLVAQAFIPPILVEAILILLAAGVVATRWRWAPHLGAVVALLTLYDPIFQPHDAYVFTHPGQSNYEFSLIVLVIAFGLVSLVACTAKVIRTHRGSGIEPRFPRLVDRLLSGFAGIVAGMIILSLVVTIVPQTSAVSASTNGQPVVHLTVDTFTPNAVVVPKGERLLIVDDSSVEHILQNGLWDANGNAHTVTEPGAPTLHNLDITSGSQEIGPFTTAGVYHIYCTIHSGMNLTIVVQ